MYDLVEAETSLAELTHMIQGNPELSNEVREEAVRMANSLFGDANWLNRISWSIVKRQNTDPQSCRRAVRYAEAASGLDPHDCTYLSTLGIAHYRLGEFQTALDVLLRSDQLNREHNGEPRAADAAFITMALAQLGRDPEARHWLDGLYELIKRPARPSGLSLQDKSTTYDADRRAFLGEAESLVTGTPPATEGD